MTKIHAGVDGLKNSICFLLTSGQVHDSRAARELIESIGLFQSNIIAVKDYDNVKIREYIESKESSYTILPRANITNK